VRTHWELEGNILGTKEKREKFSPPSPTTQNLKERKKKAL
jgi:hypothetical protein